SFRNGHARARGEIDDQVRGGRSVALCSAFDQGNHGTLLFQRLRHSAKLAAEEAAPMMFTKRLREPVMAGDVTCSVRIWRRAHVRVGGRYPLGPGHIEVTSIRE